MRGAVDEVEYTINVDGRTVPGVAWIPSSVPSPCPVVLIGHGGTFGGTGHKRAEGQVRLAHLLAERHAIAATAIGDDRIQKQTQGTVVPDSFTHGSSAQRVRWFKTGLQSGNVQSCNTFAASQL